MHFLKLTPSYQGDEKYVPNPFYAIVRLKDVSLNDSKEIIGIVNSVEPKEMYNFVSIDKAYSNIIADYISEGYKVTEK